MNGGRSGALRVYVHIDEEDDLKELVLDHSSMIFNFFLSIDHGYIDRSAYFTFTLAVWVLLQHALYSHMCLDSE